MKKTGFSPRNGEVILKHVQPGAYFEAVGFQSPQWGSNSKGNVEELNNNLSVFQSPQWGSNSKDVP